MGRMDTGTDEIGLAARTGAPDALFELGMFYAAGLEVEANLVVAHKWFNLAAMRGSGAALARRKEIALEMTAAEIAEAQRLAREWLATEKRDADRRAVERNAIEAFAAEHAASVERTVAPSAPEQVVEAPSNVVWLRAKPLAA